MKNIFFLLLGISFIVSSCSKDKDNADSLPGFSIKDYIELMEFTREDFLNEYPFAVHEETYYQKDVINSYIKNRRDLGIVELTFCSYTNNSFKELILDCYDFPHNTDKYTRLAKLIAKEDVELYEINIHTRLDWIRPDSIEELQNWLKTESIKPYIFLESIETIFTTVVNDKNIAIVWNYKGKESKLLMWYFK